MNQIEQLNYKNKEGLSLADRQKEYENITRTYLIPKQPVIIRIDGKAFHSYTKQKCFSKPFDKNISLAFEKSTKELCESLQNVEFAYHQSDEVSIFLKDYTEEKQQQFFNGNIQKIVSVATSQFTYFFNKNIKELLETNVIGDITLKPAFFDGRVFNLPLHEVSNYFIWRQRDAIRNSITSHSLAYFSQKELHKKNSDEKVNMLDKLAFEKNDSTIMWKELDISLQRGTVYYKIDIEEKIKDLPQNIIDIYIKQGKEISDTVIRNRWMIDYNIPIFSENKNFIERFVINENGNNLQSF